MIRRRSKTLARLVVALLLGAGSFGSAAGEPPAEKLEIIYLANEGFLLRSGDTAVLIDAVFGDGLFGYGVVDVSERRRLEAARPPFDSVDLALASHVHGDHFNAPAMARFLEASPQTTFISTEHAVDKLLKYDASQSDRVLGVFPAEGQQASVSRNGIDLTIYNLHHGRGRPMIQNLGLLVEICGVTILHVGDTEASQEEMQVAGLQNLAPDVALLPSWYLRPGRWTAATEQIRSRRLAAMHLPTDEAPESYFWGDLDSPKKIVAAIEADFPGTFVPRTAGESISLSCGAVD